MERAAEANSRMYTAPRSPLPAPSPTRPLSQPDAPVHGVEIEPSPTAANRAVEAARPQPAGHHEREVGHKVAVHGLGVHLCREIFRVHPRDPAVHGPELWSVTPVIPAHAR